MSNLTADERRTMQTRQVMAAFQDWGLSGAEVIDLMALQGVSARHLERFRRGDAFPKSEATDVRLNHFVGISEALRTTYPTNPKMGAVWMMTKQKRLNNQVPLQRIAVEGLAGLEAVRAYLDCTYAWDQTGSKV